MTTATRPMYVFIQDDRVVATAMNLEDAIKVARKHPEALIADTAFTRSVDTLIWTRKLKKKQERETEKANPKAAGIDKISIEVLRELHDFMDEHFPHFTWGNDYAEEKANGSVWCALKERSPDPFDLSAESCEGERGWFGNG